MKSLKDIRQLKRLSLEELGELANLCPTIIATIERGKHVADPSTRIKLRRILGQKINFLNTPTITTQAKRNSDFEECERLFRRLLRLVNSLPRDEKEAFCITASRHLRRLRK